MLTIFGIREVVFVFLVQDYLTNALYCLSNKTSFTVYQFR
jgi:hypothetical protein